ncbi:MAG: DUF5654 family protein [Candidatus Curtissbacteria bacterium]
MARQNKRLTKELLRQMITLSTSGFGLVAALAWNEAIQTLVSEYVDRYLPAGSGVISKLIYAVLITLFAVLITYQLSRIVADED